MESLKNPRAIFIAFGTKGDVHPIAAIAAAFASDQTQYKVVLITHAAHMSLSLHLAEKRVVFSPISSPPVLSALANSAQKKTITNEHREECLTAVENIFENSPSTEGDFIVINFFALEGWILAELFHVPCIVAAPYVVPYSAPSSFECRFIKEFPLLYKYLQEAPTYKVCWKDVLHWMWPLFTERWGSWRRYLNLSPCPFMDPVTGLPTLHNLLHSPLLMYGFSKEVVECPGYWPSNVRVCGFWLLPMQWEFSCDKCKDISTLFSSSKLNAKGELCSSHADLQCFLKISSSDFLIFVGLSSIGSMGLLSNPKAFLQVLKAVVETTSYRFILFSAGYEPLDAAIHMLSEFCSCSEDGVLLFSDKLFCFSGTIPYHWIFPRCAVVIHHGGSGSTSAALHVGVPQVICPFMLDQFYWAERMLWLGVAPEPLEKNQLVPDTDDNSSIFKAATALSKAIGSALSPEIKERASQVADIISKEDGVAEAVKIIKEEMVFPK